MLSESSEESDASEYDAFEALCEILFPDGENGLMFFWKAHFDGSGKKESPLLIVAGYLSTRPKWKAFRRAWNEALTNPDGSIEIFHATDFEAGRGAFTAEKGWTQERRDSVRVELVDALLGADLDVGVVCSVSPKDYEEMITGWRFERCGTMYEYCAKGCLISAARWCQENKVDQPIAYIVENGDEDQGRVQDAFTSTFRVEKNREFFRLGTLTFATKDQVMQLQAADMLAFYMRMWILGGKKPLPEPYSRLLTTNKIMWEHYSRVEFEKLFPEDFTGHRIQWPEGTIGFKAGENVDVEMTGDFSEVDNLLSELAAHVETSPDVVYPLVKDAASISKLIGVETQDRSTAETNNLALVFKPTDLARESMVALRTMDSNSKLPE
jgi:hypothetical protein